MQIAGVVLNGVLRPGDIESSLAVLADNQDIRFKKIFKLLYTQNLQLDLFRKYSVDRIFEFRILSVDNEFRGQGLAKELLKRSERVAIDNGFTVRLRNLKKKTLYECENKFYYNLRADVEDRRNRHVFTADRTVDGLSNHRRDSI